MSLNTLNLCIKSNMKHTCSFSSLVAVPSLSFSWHIFSGFSAIVDWTCFNSSLESDEQSFSLAYNQRCKDSVRYQEKTFHKFI